jgi:GT2 family glycosyltransferase
MSGLPLVGRVAIILVNWNGWRDCIECLSSLLGSDAASISDIWLVDNDSSDGSLESIVSWCITPSAAPEYIAFDGVRHSATERAAAPIPYRIWQADGTAAPVDADVQLTLVRSGANRGFAGGNNVGIVAAGLARYTHFWLLNTDTVVRHDALSHLLERFRRDPSVGMVGSTLLYYHHPDRVQALGGGTLHPLTLVTSHIGAEQGLDAVPSSSANVLLIEGQTRYVVGASMLVSREFISEVGLMCEDYFLYFEEIDWAIRGGGAYTLGYAPRSVVYHKVGSSSSKVVSEFSERLLFRNRIRFIGRFFPRRRRAALANMMLDGFRHLLRGRFVQARMVFGALRDARSLLRD